MSELEQISRRFSYCSLQGCSARCGSVAGAGRQALPLPLCPHAGSLGEPWKRSRLWLSGSSKESDHWLEGWLGGEKEHLFCRHKDLSSNP